MHRPEKPTDFPIQKPTTPAGKRAAELHKTWTEQYERANQVEVDYVAAQAAMEETQVTLRDVLSKRELGEATDKQVSAAEDAYAAAKGAAEAPWRERATAAATAVEQRRAEYEAFVDENLEELVTELEADAQAAVDTIRKAAQTIADGVATWRAVRKRAATLIAPAQLVSDQAIPLLTGSADAAATSAARLLADDDGLALPLPERRHLDQRLIDLGLPPKQTYHWSDRTIGDAVPEAVEGGTRR